MSSDAVDQVLNLGYDTFFFLFPLSKSFRIVGGIENGSRTEPIVSTFH